MSEQAHDMSRFWRLFTYQHGRVNGTFVVHAGKEGVHNVKPYEVTVYADEAHSWGRVLYSKDLTAFIRDGAVDIPKHMIAEAVRHDVQDAWGDVIAAIEACVTAYTHSMVSDDKPYADVAERILAAGYRVSSPVQVTEAMVERGFKAALASGAGQVTRADIRAALSAALEGEQ